MSEYDYTGNKIKNSFTAYLQKFIRRKRQDYIDKKNYLRKAETSLGNTIRIDFGMSLDDMIEMNQRERLLIRECKGDYINWNELSNQKLVDSLMILREEERKFIYQHVFEERTFKDIAILNGLTEEKVKNIYYYSLRKMRKWMGGVK
ncbi:sigma factor-like helix-turn-helix DNA-binding protein [Sporofaciens musculi]|uniref:sigma factor-like helix-turn-helix DNA-binding protein n=1 Tax=Sporofaciens musculi TaxID=2681861 RepID=UPI00259FF2A5|nr:sigma factor-like helix-turn-helix DNA-binding protein [Sporofaciens musculi]